MNYLFNSLQLLPQHALKKLLNSQPQSPLATCPILLLNILEDTDIEGGRYCWWLALK